MSYQWGELCESQVFEHDQKFVKAEHWKEACNKINDLIKTKNEIQAENKKLREALEKISGYIPHNGDSWVSKKAREALKESGDL